MRLVLPGIHAIEVWNLPVAGAPLQAWRSSDELFSRLAELARELIDSPPGNWSDRAREVARGVDQVYLLGGGVRPEAAPAFESAQLRALIADDPLFAAACAGTLLHQTLSVDVGQTGLKLFDGQRKWRVERDIRRAPKASDISTEEAAAARRSTLDFIAEHLRGEHHHVVLALPCALDENAVASECSYCWEDRDTTLVAELEKQSGKSLTVLNDAELAAVAARMDPRLEIERSTLVLTIGHGVGGALLEAGR